MLGTLSQASTASAPRHVVALAGDNGFAVSESDFQDDARRDRVARLLANSRFPNSPASTRALVC